MGCANGVGRRDEPLPAELQAAARKYFYLGELPVTLAAAAKGQALVVKAAGLDHDDLLLALEAGFHARRYWIKDAAIRVDKGLFLATFELLSERGRGGEEAAAEEAGAERAMASGRGSVSVKMLAGRAASGGGANQGAAAELPNLLAAAPAACTDGADQEAALEELRFTSMPTINPGDTAGSKGTPLATAPVVSSPGLHWTAKIADQHAARLGAHVRLTIVREWAPGLRLALKRTIQDSGLRIVMARLSVSASAARRTVKDTFWLASDQRKEGEAFGAAATVDAQVTPSLRSARTLLLRGASTTLLSSAESAGAPAWISELSASLCSAQPKELSVNSPVKGQEDGVEEVLQRITESDPLDERRLPASLQRKAASLQYRVEQSPGWGLQFDSIDKYTGSGMGVAHSGRHVLEFATFFIRRPTDEGHDAPASPWGATFAALTGAMKRESVAEFITEYHPDRSCLTIFKVFLNDVLPPGVRAGARATAEQLPTMPVSADGKWSGADALRSLRTVHLCDVVNWNTYCLMSMVGKTPGDELERMLLVEEAKASGFTLADIQSKRAVEVFVRTGLGKLVMGVLKIWKEEHSVEHKIKDVSIAWSSSEFELIQGDYRKVMDVYIELERPSGEPDMVTSAV